jgi:hypothetical protein
MAHFGSSLKDGKIDKGREGEKKLYEREPLLLGYLLCTS